MKDMERQKKAAKSQKKKKERSLGGVLFVWNLFKAVKSIWGSLGTHREATKSCVYQGRMRDAVSHCPKLFGSQSFFSRGRGGKSSFFNLKDKNKNEGGQWKYSLGGIRGNNILKEILNNMAESMVDLSENFAEKMQ